MINYNTGKVPPSAIILPFYATGALAFLLLCILLVWSPESLLAHYFNPHLLTIVHTAALGWGTMIIFGASYQLMPVISERNLKSNDLVIASWYILLAGVILLAWSFWDFRTGWIMITGGSLVTISSIFYLINALFTGALSRQSNIQRYFIISSACWLVFTVVVGLLLAINLKYPFFSRNHMEILKIHAHLGLAGWFLQLIAGVSSKLIPMFLLGRSEKNRLLVYAFILQNLGLILFIADVYFMGYSNRILIYLFLEIIGIVCWLYFLVDNFKSRMRKKIDIQMRHAYVSLLCLVLGLLTIPLIHYYQSSSGGQASTVTMVYGTFLFMGWITGLILGQTFKTLPFIVWNDHYKELTGRVKVPLPRDLYRERLLKVQFWLYLTALLFLVSGISLGQLQLIRVGAILWVGVAGLYGYNVSQILFHKTKTIELNPPS